MFWSGPNQLFNQTLLKMEPVLASEGYVGYIDLNCIVNNHGIYPLEFTVALRISDDQHPAGGNADADRPVLSRPWRTATIPS